MKKCPKCGCKEFYVTANVAQDWLVNSDGCYIETIENCASVIHFPNDEDIWQCADCYYDAEGKEFEIEEE